MMGILDVFLGALLAFAATAAGAAGLLLMKNLSQRGHLLIISFSAGVMLYSAADMLAQSFWMGGPALAFCGLLLGGAALFALEKLLPHAHALVSGKGHSGLSHQGRRAALIAGTITLHNIPEGFAIASAFAASGPLGWLISVSIAMQDLLEGLVVSAPLAAYGVSRKNSVFWGVFSGAVEGAAAVGGYFVIAATAALTPAALGFSAGAMAFVTLFELLPDAFSCKDRKLPAAALVAGIAAAFAIATLLAVKQ
jgi:ZIP family zinc transporter